jgi:signal transduction histidine kinase
VQKCLCWREILVQNRRNASMSSMLSSIVEGLRRASLVLLIGGLAGLAVHAGSRGTLQVQSWSPIAIGNSILVGVLYVALLDGTVRLARLVLEAFLPPESDRAVLYHALGPAAAVLLVFVALTAGLKGALGTSFPPPWPFLLGIGGLAAITAGSGTGFLALRSYYRRDRQDHAEGWEARMRRLRTRTCPPVLFSTLEAVVPRLENAPEESRALLRRLDALLRYRHEAPGSETVPLAEEIEAALWYVELAQVQHGDDLEIGFDVPDPLLSVEVPRLSLLPLLENAVQHGLADADGSSCTITVTGRRDDAELCLAVLDTGPGFDTTDPTTVLRRGSGISDLYARLREHFGAETDLSLLPQGVLWCAPIRAADAPESTPPASSSSSSPSPSAL